MNYLESIQQGLDAQRKHTDIARKIFITHPTSAFIENEEKQFDILDEVSQFFKIPITHVHVVGSSKIGQSLHKKTKFTLGKSDLDIALVDSNLFIYYSEMIYTITRGFNDLSNFSLNKNGVSNFEEYSQYLLKGIFRPDLMPSCKGRADWLSFFGKLSRKHSALFGGINASIYLSQHYFEVKQISTIKNYIKLQNGGL
ncbi:hypothetical protein J2Y45_000406 [Dyadobacter sp. BE34]|uniref:Polymerase nucleotidyl transferase domain-containing protein n=1 Tax=Dyadobacter fermentans TaxID=94254 RepID=A0ABU1QPR5_9BACT|nr:MULTISPECIES: hypothetical protein [Dyadobacter]MDR6803136.1 hypothetical protein [Dyadobacter fermentans]MDR7040878.1 hypothetical protein [Dyadobacter sp. BE242]MDR7195280.1 hypothetical protein [Dyadobacter sp. BE34]MDR7214174.1 hypothetical protein [Dyadobacter sp. BE31]MDR7260688.1 hypothetical protein [Dyadobacter sp. BE32]